jgi:hypothetical protein
VYTTALPNDSDFESLEKELPEREKKERKDVSATPNFFFFGWIRNSKKVALPATPGQYTFLGLEKGFFFLRNVHVAPLVVPRLFSHSLSFLKAFSSVGCRL